MSPDRICGMTLGSEVSVRDVLRAMIDTLPREALLELEAALASDLSPAPTASEARSQELGQVAAMLAELPVSARRLTRSTYDRQRTPEAPSSSTLVNRYGSWVRVRRAARALTDGDYSTTGTARAWATPTRGRRRPPDYTRGEVIRAVRRCAAAIGRPVDQLTSSAYYEWVAAERRRARERGAEPPRLPTQRSVERYFKSWASLRANAVSLRDSGGKPASVRYAS